MATTAAQVANTSSIVSPARLAHVVLRTSRFKEIIDWYKLVLNSKPVFESEGIAFLAYDEEHHRIAVINVPDLASQPKGIAGIHHVAFTYDSLSDLLGNFARLREHGILPAWAVNHGPTTSLYYADPDGNQMEFQVDNYDTVEEAGEFFFTEEFAKNALGVDFDPEELRQRLLAGENEQELKLRPKSGPRAVHDSPLD